MGTQTLLMPIGWLYGKIADLRNTLYDRGVFKSHDLGARTISIGNITMGGTGKTPLVAHVAEILADAGEKVCILTRGYGRESSGLILVSDGEKVVVDARTGGDEPVELGRKLLGKAIVVADADRVFAAKWARENFDVTAFVLDDGFQHRRARRDVDIVCVDAADPFGGGAVPPQMVGPEIPNPLRRARVLPAGRLREPLANLKRADAMVITRANLSVASPFIAQEFHSRASKNAKIFAAAFRIGEIRSLQRFTEGSGSDGDSQLSAGAFAFCALGNPEGFSRQLEEQEFSLVGMMKFEDHHGYEQSDIERIEEEASRLGAECLVTTAKDAVKLSNLNLSMPCFVLEISLSIDHPEDFRDLIISS